MKRKATQRSDPIPRPDSISRPGAFSEARTWWLPRVWAAFLLLLLALTYRLWIPTRTFPAVPLWQPLAEIPPSAHWLALTGLVVSLIAVLVFENSFRWTWWLVTASLLISFSLDQHRLQPWAYQAAVHSVVFATMDARQARRWLIPLGASVYLYSAAGKLDYQFAHTVGQDFLSVALGWMGGWPQQWDEAARVRIALLMPATEALLGLGVLIPSTRRAAGVLVIAMHAGLIGLLSPWGLDHSYGVLGWNGLLIAQAGLLFVRRGRDTKTSAVSWNDRSGPARSLPSRAGTRLAQAAVMVALIAPLGERAGYWDHWLSWALYSPHNSRTDVEIHASAIEKLPPRMAAYVGPDRDGDRWRDWALDRWSLETLGVPIYPQARYQLALAVKVSRRHQIDRGVRAILKGVSDRRTGRRSEQRLLGRREMERALDQFWLTSSTRQPARRWER